MKRIILAVAAGAAAFHLYTAGFTPLTALIQRPIHLALMSVLAFAGVGGRHRGERPHWLRILDVILGGAALFSCLYLVFEQDELVLRAGTSTAIDLIAGTISIFIVLELARRTTGWGLVVIAVLALIYGLAGPYLPGFLAHRGYSLTRLVQHLYLSTEGIWGVPLGVSADFVYLFVLFGAVLDTAGGGVMLIGLANRIAGRTRGGPAKTAAVASAIMGSLSGSAVANVVTTGSVTIPMMKRSGFSDRFSAAVEAAASTGGQFMPPVMGAGAFILATWTNIPYLQVAVAAAVPALLYYVALFWTVHFRALRRDIPLPEEDERKTSVLGTLHLLVPLAIIVVFLAMGRSPMRAAFWGVIAAMVATTLVKSTRLNLEGWGQALRAAGAGTVQVASACAAAGIVVGVASLTGIGLRMSELVISLSGGQLPIALMLTAVGSVVLGMGLPTTAAYVVLAALGAPALTELGVPLLSAHLFIFYFGCISNVTPPVALAAYAGAGIAGSPPFRTAVTAAGIAGAGYLVPFMFVYDPALLLNASAFDVIIALGTGALGMVAMASAGVGYAARVMKPFERAFMFAGAIALFTPNLVLDGIGLAIGIGVFLMTRSTASAVTTASDE